MLVFILYFMMFVMLLHTNISHFYISHIETYLYCTRLEMHLTLSGEEYSSQLIWSHTLSRLGSVHIIFPVLWNDAKIAMLLSCCSIQIYNISIACVVWIVFLYVYDDKNSSKINYENCRKRQHW
jgi:hypothetical protein